MNNQNMDQTSMENTSADTVDEEALQIEKKRKRQQRTLIFISILVSLYLIAQLGMLFLPMSIGIKILLFITVTGIGGCFIYVAKSRYNEIRSGEEDDLSNY